MPCQPSLSSRKLTETGNRFQDGVPRVCQSVPPLILVQCWTVFPRLDEKEFKLLDQESNWCKLGIKEAIHIRKNSPALNQDEGRHRLTHTWDPILKPVSGFRQLPACQRWPIGHRNIPVSDFSFFRYKLIILQVNIFFSVEEDSIIEKPKWVKTMSVIQGWYWQIYHRNIDLLY